MCKICDLRLEMSINLKRQNEREAELDMHRAALKFGASISSDRMMAEASSSFLEATGEQLKLWVEEGRIKNAIFQEILNNAMNKGDHHETPIVN